MQVRHMMCLACIRHLDHDHHVWYLDVHNMMMWNLDQILRTWNLVELYEYYIMISTRCQHENLVEKTRTRTRRSRTDLDGIITRNTHEVNTNETRRSRRVLCGETRKFRPCDLTESSPHGTLAKPASDTKVSKCFCGYFCAYNHTLTYTKILKDSILIKHEDIFIKVFKTLF